MCLIIWICWALFVVDITYQMFFDSLFERSFCLCYINLRTNSIVCMSLESVYVLDMICYCILMSSQTQPCWFSTRLNLDPKKLFLPWVFGLSPNLHHRLVLKKNIVTKLTQSKMKVWLAICNDNCSIRRFLEIINISIINIILYFRSSANV